LNSLIETGGSLAADSLSRLKQVQAGAESIA